MILPKLAHAVREQNWFTVVIELLVVVAGILIGLQLDSLNQERQDRIEEKRVLKALVIDVEDAISLRMKVQKTLLGESMNLIEAVKIIQKNEPGEFLSADQCEAVWRSHIMLAHFSSRLVSVDELVSSGHLGLLRNAQLRTALIAFHNRVERDRDNIEFIENDVANVVDTYAEMLQRSWSSTANSSIVICDLQLIQSSQTVRNKLLSNLGRRRGLEAIAQEQIEVLHEIQTMIDSKS